MIIKLFKNKIIKILIILFVVILLYIFPSKKEYKLDKTINVLNENKYHEIFLIDKNNMLSKTNIVINSIKLENLAQELIEILIIDGKYVDRIPNGFQSILPVDTKINNISINNDTISIDFNDKLFDSDKFSDETIIESIIYTLTSIKNINKVKILINGKQLNKLPKSGLILDELLTRDFGINKDYDINSIKNITKVTIYYNNTFNNNVYYVPVTKYLNTDKNKIKIIIDELTGRNSYNTNLISYLNSNTELLNYSFNEEELDLNFNEYLFDNKEEQKVLEEVIYSIKYSIQDTLHINKVNLFVNNKEIKKK